MRAFLVDELGYREAPIVDIDHGRDRWSGFRPDLIDPLATQRGVVALRAGSPVRASRRLREGSGRRAAARRAFAAYPPSLALGPVFHDAALRITAPAHNRQLSGGCPAVLALTD